MRLLIRLQTKTTMLYDNISKHDIQGFIYNMLRDTPFVSVHDRKGFKFFTFSDLYPSSKILRENSILNLLIASPEIEFIKTLHEKTNELNEVRLGPGQFKMLGTKMFKLKLSSRFITGSPIVLYKSNTDNVYFSFKRDGDLLFFLERLKDNAIKKYQAYYGEEAKIHGEIFDSLVFRKEVVLPVRMKDKSFIVIGSLFSELHKMINGWRERKFYSFLMDCGLGEKNSLGFGFINPIRKGG